MVPAIFEGFVSIIKKIAKLFSKKEGGQRPFATFPKINPFWYTPQMYLFLNQLSEVQ